MAAEIERLERGSAVRKLKAAAAEEPRSGYIYVIRASEQYQSVYKIGRTRDLKRRLREHGTAMANSPDVMYVLRSDNVHAVETCIRGWLRDRQWKSHVKYNEVYKADLDMIKGLVHGCEGIGARLKHVAPLSGRSALRDSSQHQQLGAGGATASQTGSLFVVIDAD